MQKLINTQHVNKKVWETDTKKRNKNNEIKFYINEDVNLIIGDQLLMFDPKFHTNMPISTYTVTDITERRAGTLTGKDYVTANVEWSNIPHHADTLQ